MVPTSSEHSDEKRWDIGGWGGREALLNLTYLRSGYDSVFREDVGKCCETFLQICLPRKFERKGRGPEREWVGRQFQF